MNTNCLEGFQCPERKCKSFGPFRIEVKTMLTVEDDGGGDTENNEWEDDSHCECVQCGQSGTVADFQTNRPILIDVAGLIDGHGKRVKDIATARAAIEECIYSYMNDYLGEILTDADCGVEDVED